MTSRPSFRRERALWEIAERGLRVAEALTGRLESCRTTAETLRLAEAFSQLSEEVCGAIALEAELRRERENRERNAAQRVSRGEVLSVADSPAMKRPKAH